MLTCTPAVAFSKPIIITHSHMYAQTDRHTHRQTHRQTHTHTHTHTLTQTDTHTHTQKHAHMHTNAHFCFAYFSWPVSLLLQLSTGANVNLSFLPSSSCPSLATPHCPWSTAVCFLLAAPASLASSSPTMLSVPQMEKDRAEIRALIFAAACAVLLVWFAHCLQALTHFLSTRLSPLLPKSFACSFTFSMRRLGSNHPSNSLSQTYASLL